MGAAWVCSASSWHARLAAVSYQGEASTRFAGRSAHIWSRKKARAKAAPVCAGTEAPPRSYIMSKVKSSQVQSSQG